MTLTEIYSLLIASIPSLVNIIAIVTFAAKAFNQIKEIKKEVVKTQEFEELKRQLKIAHAENVELQKRVKELLEVVTRIKQNEKSDNKEL